MLIEQLYDSTYTVPRGKLRRLEASTTYRRSVEDFSGLWQFMRLASSMEPIGLDGLQEVALMNRRETKYVVREQDLLNALVPLTSRYWVLEIDGIRLHRYLSLYFDTPSFFLYHRHRAGGKHRYKVRAREYTDTRLAFLEIKHKISELRTEKSRVQTPQFLTDLSSEFDEFVQDHFPLPVEELEPKLLNAYRRITLVGKYNPERVTLDLGPRFYADSGNATLPGIAIAEVKYENNGRGSDFMRRMREMGLRPMGFSKYCVGVSMLYPHVKNHYFRPTMRAVGKIMQGD